MKSILVVLLTTVFASGQAKMSPGAAEMSKLLGLGPSLEQARTSVDARLDVTEAILASSLEVDGVLAELENEEARAAEVRAALEAERDRRVGLNSVANIITGGGVGAGGQALQIKHSTAGNLLGAITGGISTVLSFVAIHQQHGGKLPLGQAPNMLAKFFDRPAEFHSDYPEAVWTYLNSVPPGDSADETRRQQLIRKWTAEGHIGKDPTRIDLLTSGVSQQRALSIDVLSDRAAMLAEVRAMLFLMKRDLGKLLLYARESRKAAL